MSSVSKLNIARLNDAVLGCFSRLPPSETIDHLVRYLGTWSGTDKFFMVIQYGLKILIPFLKLRARLQHRAGLSKTAYSGSAEGLAKLGAIIGDSRMLWRIWGLLPIIQWLVSLERTAPATRKHLTIERLQAWSMLAYYPLEHFYYLFSHGILKPSVPNPLSIIDSSKKPLKVDSGALGMLSCRFWAAYVFLQFAHLREDRKLLVQKQRSLRKAKGTAPAIVEKQDLDQRWKSHWREIFINLGYLPLTLHWSLEKGLFKDEIWVGVFGLVAAVLQFQNGWQATALRLPPPSDTVEKTMIESSDATVEPKTLEASEA